MSHASGLKKQQLTWSRLQGHEPDKNGYLSRPEANLRWLTARTRTDFESADGHEFGRGGRPAKIAALHSSSALAVNVFDYWSARDRTCLASALQLPEDITDIRFEQKFPTGVGPRSPNIDVILSLSGGAMLAIESKFCETFRRGKGSIQDKYFDRAKSDGVQGSAHRWMGVGLAGAQKTADLVRQGSPFKFLDACQLLKHMLGLAQSGVTWQLLLLWFAPSTEVGKAMDDEAARFSEMLGQDARYFRAMTYQAFWNHLRPALSGEHQAYVDYLESRYFGGTSLEA